MSKTPTQSVQPNPFGEWMKEERKAQNITRYRMAKLVGCSFGEIQAYEEGRSEPKRDRINQIAKALGLTEIPVF